MAEGWKRRWSPSGKNSKKSLKDVLCVHPFSPSSTCTWDLPLSKSHALRYLFFAAQSKQVVVFSNVEHSGEDIIAMRDCLRQLGVEIEDSDSKWTVHGVGPHGFKPSPTVLNARNSGVTFRFLTALCSRIHGIHMLDGDSSLRNRPHDSIFETLSQIGVHMSFGHNEETLPIIIQGAEIECATITIDASSTSQPLSAWIAASPGFSHQVTFELSQDIVSQRHAMLSFEMAKMFGGHLDWNGTSITVDPWIPTFEHQEIAIPLDASMQSFAFLFCKVLDAEIKFPVLPSDDESIGHEIIHTFHKELGFSIENNLLNANPNSSYVTIDLKDANDLITPLTAIMALGGGGELTSISHASHKESNRVQSTISVLNQFGIIAHHDKGAIHVEGGQTIQTPDQLIQTFDDHRIQMTATILALAAKKPVFVEGSELHAVADPMAIRRLKTFGADITVELLNLNSKK